LNGEKGQVIKLFSSPAHCAPVAKILYSKGTFYIPAFKGMIEGQEIEFEGTTVKKGNIMKLKNVPIKTEVYCIESRPKDGGKFIKTAGSYATVSKIIGEEVFVTMPSKKKRDLTKNVESSLELLLELEEKKNR
jgi:large subunit ribosomal protein L2